MRPAQVVERPIKLTATSGALIGKGNFAHFMLKEIYEQPAVIGDTLHGLLNPWNEVVVLPPMSLDPTRISKLTLVGCGTSYHAALVARVLVRAHRPRPRRSRYRLRVPLPRLRDAGGRRCHLHLAVGGDRRHAGGDGVRPQAGSARAQRRQRAGKLDVRQADGASSRTPARRSAWPRPRPSPPS